MNDKQSNQHYSLFIVLVLINAYGFFWINQREHLIVDAEKNNSQPYVHLQNSVTPKPKQIELVHNQHHPNDNLPQCLSFNESMKEILSEMSQVFITASAKAAGTTLFAFTKECQPQFEALPLGFSSFDLTQTYNISSIITHHIRNSDAMMNLAKGVTDSSLIIHSYRSETDRLFSSIKHVAWSICTGKNKLIFDQFQDHIHINDDGDECIIEEEALIEIIRSQKGEIGYTTQRLWTCDTFDTIDEFQPNIVVMHYKQVNQMQKVLAEKYCPNLMHRLPMFFRGNRGDIRLVVKLANPANDSKAQVVLEEWIEVKKDLLEWSLGMYENASCRGKIRQMESHLLGCEDEIMAISKVPSFI